MCWKCQNLSAIAWYLTFFNQRWRCPCFLELDAPELSSRTIEGLELILRNLGKMAKKDRESNFLPILHMKTSLILISIQLVGGGCRWCQVQPLAQVKSTSSCISPIWGRLEEIVKANQYGAEYHRSAPEPPQEHYLPSRTTTFIDTSKMPVHAPWKVDFEPRCVYSAIPAARTPSTELRRNPSQRESPPEHQRQAPLCYKSRVQRRGQWSPCPLF